MVGRYVGSYGGIYKKKKNGFTVNIVLIRNRHSISGIVFFLALSLIYTGSLNEGLKKMVLQSTIDPIEETW